MALPARAGAVGPIVAMQGDGRALSVVTAATDDSGDDPELWISDDADRWSEPIALPLRGEPLALGAGPFGTLVVGERRGRAAALLVELDGQATVFGKPVADHAPLRVAIASAARDAWAATAGAVLGFAGGRVAVEEVEDDSSPVAMALDVVGIPWLLTERAVLRRHASAGRAMWRAYHRGAEASRFLAMGFRPDAAHVMDERGGSTMIRPGDVDSWQPTRLY
jgi:hypothetical protein